MLASVRACAHTRQCSSGLGRVRAGEDGRGQARAGERGSSAGARHSESMHTKSPVRNRLRVFASESEMSLSIVTRSTADTTDRWAERTDGADGREQVGGQWASEK